MLRFGPQSQPPVFQYRIIGAHMEGRLEEIVRVDLSRMPRARTPSMGGCDVGGRRLGIGILPSRLFADSGKVFIGGLVAQGHVWDGFL